MRMEGFWIFFPTFKIPPVRVIKGLHQFVPTVKLILYAAVVCASAQPACFQVLTLSVWLCTCGNVDAIW
jgi:hypothetical protein